jgi:hypothetical protein
VGGAVRREDRTLLPLLPRRRAAAFVFLPADELHHHTTPTPALRPVATKVRTTASLPMWMPRPSSRGGTRSRSAPPLVMPAFVPGWDNSFAGAAAFVDARSLSWPSLSLSMLIAVPCRSRPRYRAEPFALAFAFAFARVVTRTRRPRSIVHPFCSRRTRRRV